MELFHTSPNVITRIDTLGRFGEFLCFASEPYVQTTGRYVIYRIDVDEDEIIDVSRLFYHEEAEKLSGLVRRVMEKVGCTEDEAEDLLAHKTSIHDRVDVDVADAGEIGWDIQGLAAQAGKILGYRGIKMRDEQGTVYLLDMLGLETELERCPNPARVEHRARL